jgi:hypothetical protein
MIRVDDAVDERAAGEFYFPSTAGNLYDLSMN